jgi:outer membrane receptor protein involved in Fe transport
MSNMHRQHSPAHRQQQNHVPAKPFSFRLSPIAAVIAGLCFTGPAPVYAADDKAVTELQAEIARLKQALENSQRALAAEKSAHSAGPAESAAKVPETQSVVTEQKQAASQAEQPVALDAVVVRARNRIERLQDVPLSVSVVTGGELEKLGATDVGSITKRAGNISWNYGNQRTFSLSLRGIGKQGQTEAQDPAVGLIIDGVPYSYNALASSYDFTDIDTIEVARGPQGTLLGKNASLGAVTINTKRPSFTPSANYSLTLGDYDTVKGTFAAGGPIVDNLLAWRGSFSASKARGDIINQYNHDLTYTNTDRLTGRVQFLLTPTPDFTARIGLDATPRAGEFTNGRTTYTPTPTKYANGSANSLPTDAATRLARPWFKQNLGYTYIGDYLYGGPDGTYVSNDGARPLVTGSNGAFADLNWNLGSHTLTSITAYKDYHFNAVNDEGTPFDINRNSGGFWNDYKQISQELRLSSKAGGFVDYQAGLYFARVTNFNDYRKVFGNDAGAWFASTSQYSTLAPIDGAAALVANPSLRASGQYLLQSSLANLSLDFNSPSGIQNIDNKSQAVFGQANWHLSDALTVTTGLRFTHENRQNTASNQINNNGSAPELNPSVVNGVVLGGFDTYANSGASAVSVLNGQVVASGTPGSTAVAAGGVALTTDTTNAALHTTAGNQANYAALKYFGIATWAGLSSNQQKQIAAAQAIRKSQIGVLFNTGHAQPFTKTTPSYVISPTYKVNDNLTTYVSVQHGEKAGVAQFTNGVSNPVKEEKTTAYEFGFKSALLDKTLIFNADIYLMNVKDYQQTAQVLDVYTTTLNNDGKLVYTNATGNVPKVQTKGIEVDGVYGGIRNTTIRFAGAYTDARYKEFKNSALPNEWNFTGNPFGSYRDVSGKTLPGAAKWTYNIGVDYRQPVFADKEFHSNVNVAYTSRWNSDVTLSDYAWVGSSYITDFAIGLGARNRSYDVSLVIKNALNDKTHLTQSWNSYTPAFPRSFGFVFSGKL